jgi:Family of unknown function (DUF6263)
MINKAVILFVCISCTCCKFLPGSNRRYDDNNPGKVYHLRLNPVVGSQYTYTVTRSTEFVMEVEGKKVDNKSRATMEVTYTIGKDSIGEILLGIVYNKIHLYTRNGDTEQEEDADKAGNETADPVEKMLGILKGASLRAVVNSAGQIKSMQGDEAIKDKLLAGFRPSDTYAKTIASQQWDRQVKDGLLKNNMEQLFNIFPDSAVHVGDRWKLSSTQHEAIDMVNKASFQLKEIVDGTAVIRSEGEISSDHSSGSLNGTSYTADLIGKQEGDIAMETATGMLLSNTSESEITGTISSMGRDVPVTITISMKLEGRRVN